MKGNLLSEWNALNCEIVACERCPRLRAYCQQVAQTKRRAFREERYWGKPVPNFGRPDARLLIVGLAPAAHGGNRTGRLLTGDASGDFLFDALYEVGFCNQPTSTHYDDGLELYDCALCAAVRCAPPHNKPTAEERAHCFPFLVQTVRLMPRLQGLLALGQVAMEACVALARSEGWLPPDCRPQFEHGALYPLEGGRFLAVSYHPSARNTYTKLLTKPMMVELLRQVRHRLYTLEGG